jgi:uroporphyrinogen-III synthase
MRVWVTRAEPGADQTAARLVDLGHVAVVHPLLAIRSIDADVNLSGVRALAFTSANGVRAFVERWGAPALPVYAVGDATAAAARAAGFAEVFAGDGDVAALAELIAARSPGPVLHPGARMLAGDLEGDLRRRGVEVRTVAVYESVALPPPDPLPQVEAVLVHSPAAARALAAVPAARRLRALCISPAAAAPLREAGFDRVDEAPFPNEAALLKLLAVEGA